MGRFIIVWRAPPQFHTPLSSTHQFHTKRPLFSAPKIPQFRVLNCKGHWGTEGYSRMNQRTYLYCQIYLYAISIISDVSTFGALLNRNAENFYFFILLPYKFSAEQFYACITVSPAILLLLIRLNFLVSGTYTHGLGERYQFSPKFRVIIVDKMFHRDLYSLVSIACTISFDFYVAINYSLIKSIYLLWVLRIRNWI